MSSINLIFVQFFYEPLDDINLAGTKGGESHMAEEKIFVGRNFDEEIFGEENVGEENTVEKILRDRNFNGGISVVGNTDDERLVEENFVDENTGAGNSGEENLRGKNSGDKFLPKEISTENFSTEKNFSEGDFVEKIASLGGRLYVAGGWVRDMLIGRVPPDKDYVVCGLDAETFARNFPARSVGGKFPVFLLGIDGRSCEVALARTEVKTGTGYRGFEARFSRLTTIEEDLFRRDTTINSMAMELPSGEIIDPFGGRCDITAGVIRATSIHFCEDPVRALRAARQAAQLNFRVDEKTLELMRACRLELAGEPQERIFAEAEKALRAPRPELFFTCLWSAKLLDLLFPELDAQEDFDRAMGALTRVSKLTDAPEARFAALIILSFPHANLTSLENVAARMKLPRRWVRFARFVIEEREKLIQPTPADVVELMGTMERLSISPEDLLAVLRSVFGVAPDFLSRYNLYHEILARAREKFSIPEDLPPAERGTWIKIHLADELARYFFEGEK